MTGQTRTVEFKAKEYEVSFDEYNELDTVRNIKTGNYLKSTNSIVKKINSNKKRIFFGLDKLD